MFKRPIKALINPRILITLFAVLILLVSLPLIIRAKIKRDYSNHILTTTEIAQQSVDETVVIVFGAGVWANGQLSHVLQDRMDTAINLYQQTPVSKVILSGDNRHHNYNEPVAMLNYAKEAGLAEEDLQPDYAGRRTYDTCYRARHIFGIEKAVLVTQEFHLSRALFICNALGIEAIGVIADKRSYVNADSYEQREILATSKALLDVVIKKPAAIMGQPISLVPNLPVIPQN